MAPAEKQFQKTQKSLKELPTLPAVVMEVQELIRNPYSSTEQLARVLKQDQAIAAKILKLVNSSYYAVPGGVSDLKKALSHLGFTTVSQLVLGISIIGLLHTRSLADFSLGQFWRHALSTAWLGEKIAKQLKVGNPEEIFTAGLLHDIGKLILIELDPESFQARIQKAKEDKSTFFEAETALGLSTHADIGAETAEHWNLPPTLIAVIRHHHQGVQTLPPMEVQLKQSILVVKLANSLVQKNGIGQAGSFGKIQPAPEIYRGLGLEYSEVEKIESLLQNESDGLGALFHVFS